MNPSAKKWLRGIPVFPRNRALPVNPGIILILGLFLILLISGCEKEMQNLYEPSYEGNIRLKSGTTCETPLVTSENIPTGLVSVTFNLVGDQLTVTYSTANTPYLLFEINFDVQASPAAFPQNPNGKPMPNKFAYFAKPGGITEWSQVVELTAIQGWETGDTVFIAARAEVKQGQGNKTIVWGSGMPFPGNYGGMYFYCIPQALPFSCGNPFVDLRNNQVYNTVQIEGKCWMARNLNIGQLIGNMTAQSDNAVMEKYCQANAEEYCDTYGGLYQWNEMMQYVEQEGAKGICPEGWHLPSFSEFDDLILFLGGQDAAGGAMKEAGLSHWNEPNTGATNSSGFTALPGGTYNPLYSSFNNMGFAAYFWSSTPYEGTEAWNINLNWYEGMAYESIHSRDQGYSVRCVKDQ